MNFQLPYDEKLLDLSLPEDLQVMKIVPKFKQAASDTDEIVSDALKHPLSEMPLEFELRKGEQTTIVLSRQWHRNGVGYILPKVLEMLAACGIFTKDINLLLAHSYDLPQSSIERVGELREFSNCKVSVFDPDDNDDLVHVGKTASDIDVFMARSVVMAERLILIDAVAPDFLTGFSGPPHLLVPGCVGRSTAEQLCRTMNRMDYDQLTNLLGFGRMQDNPYASEILQILKFANIDFVIATIVNSITGQPEWVYAGEIIAVHERSCESVKEIARATIATTPQLIIMSPGGAPYDMDLCSVLVSLATINGIDLENTTVILLAQCPQGLDASGQLNRDRLAAILGDSQTDDLEFHAREWPIYLAKEFLQRNKLILISEARIQLPHKRFRSIENRKGALESILSHLNPEQVWVIPNARFTWIER